MRWYDIEPDVCMAISMIECAEKKHKFNMLNILLNS